ncbi:MAG TPA: hypothetical protein VH054_28745 [Polyangiaceae bacterium]|jgi:hypothetical protein|nr:hypothetical protein [Polyangiaceae bacterium]
MRPLKHYASKVHESLSSSGVDGEGNRKLAVNVIDEAIARLARRIDSQFDASGRRQLESEQTCALKAACSTAKSSLTIWSGG